MLSKCSNIHPTILGRTFIAIALAMLKTQWNIKTSRYSTTMFLSPNTIEGVDIDEDCRQNDVTFIPPFLNRFSSSCLEISIQETNGWTMLETTLCHLKTHVKGFKFFYLARHQTWKFELTLCGKNMRGRKWWGTGAANVVALWKF